MLTSIHKTKIKEMLEWPETFGLVLLVIVLDNYGTESLNWELETILSQLEDDFGAKLPKINKDKLGSMITALTSDTVLQDWFSLNVCCEALNNDPISFDVLDPVTPEQLAWGIVELGLLFDKDDQPKYSDEVCRYMGVVLAEAGFSRAPKVLSMAVLPQWMDPNALEDKDIYAGHFNKVSSDIDQLNLYVHQRVAELMEQLDAVPLENRDMEAWRKAKSSMSRTG